MADPLAHWVGRDESEGIPVQPRKDVAPPPHWRLEAIAATERPRSLTLGADRRHAVFIQDRETSDVWLLDLDEPHAVPQRLTTGRAPDALLGGRRAAALARRRAGRVRRRRATCGSSPAAGGPPRQLLEAAGPVWIDDATLLVSVERGDTTRLAVVEVADPWPRRLARRGRRPRRRVGAGRLARPLRGRVRLHAARRPQPLRDPRRHARDGRGARAHRHAADAGPRAGVVARRQRRSPTSPSARAPGRCTPSAATASGERQLTARRRRLRRAGLAPRRRPRSSSRARSATASASPSSTPASGAARELAPGGLWSAPHWTAGGGVIAHVRGPRDAAGAAPAVVDAAASRAAHAARARRPLAVRRAPARPPRGRHVQLARRARDPRLPVPARERLARAARRRRSSIRTAARPTPTATSGTATRSTSSTRATPGWRSTSAARPATGASSSARNHGVWGVEDVWDCLAAADHLRTLDWVDGDRLGIFGASYGSYMALLSVTDDPEHRFRCAVAKYGDCDILTSWAQGDREGVQDLERMMGHPSTARAAYRAGSPVHRLEQRRGAAADRARRARRARQPEAVRGAGRGAAPARQDVRVPDLPDRGARPAARRPAAPLLPPARAFPRLVPDLRMRRAGSAIDDVPHTLRRVA